GQQDLTGWAHVDPNGGGARNEGRPKSKEPRSRMPSRLGHSMPEERGRLFAHLRRWRTEELTHSRIGGRPRRPDEQRSDNGEDQRPPDEARHRTPPVWSTPATNPDMCTEHTP